MEHPENDDQYKGLKVNKGIADVPTVNPYIKKRVQRKVYTPSEFVEGILKGNITILSQAVTLVESSKHEHQQVAQEIIEKCLPFAGKSVRIGITGVPGAGKSTSIDAFGMHLIGILAALIMNKTAFRGKPVPFVMELPNYRMPGLKSVALLLWEKAKDFLQRAFTVIFLATIIIWFLQSFDTRLNVVADSANSLLALIGQFIAPVFRPLGFGDWRCATALISGFIAKESVVSTLQVLLGGAAISSLLTTRSAISFLVFTLLYTPCVAAIATIRRELDSRLKTVGVVVLQCSVAWVVAFAAYAIAGLV